VWAALAASALVAACLADRQAPSVWPPDDFGIDVAGEHRRDDGGLVRQRFQVFADGLAVYREAVRALPEVGIELPLFESVSIYELRPESLRTLARLLNRAGLYELDVGQDVNRGIDDPVVVVHWRAFGGAGQISSLVDSGGVLDRVVHVINSFLPPERAFAYPELSGEIEPPHVSRAPAPLDWIGGALICHKKLVELHPDDIGLRLDLLALAVEARDGPTARKQLEWIESRGPDEQLAGAGFDWERDALGPLREAVRGLR
jgi:hypothetical protein